MKKYLLFALIATSLAPMFGQKKDYRLEVGQFDKILVTDNVNVVYRNVPDSTGYIAFEGEDEFADAFIFSNNKGKLLIQVNTEDVGKPNLPTVRVYSDFLTSVENSGLFTLTVFSNVAVPVFKAKLVGNGKISVNDIKANEVEATLSTGNGTLSISGIAREASLKMVGTGVIQADMLKTHTVKCKILGSGSIGCWATDKLDVRGIGSTKIYYKGEPEIKKVGGGKVFPLTASTHLESDSGEDED